MLRLRMLAPSELTDDVIRILEQDDAVSGLAVMRGAALRPKGDMLVAEVAREAANDVIERLRAIGLHRVGTIEIESVQTWLSRSGFDCEVRAPGSSADAVVSQPGSPRITNCRRDGVRKRSASPAIRLRSYSRARSPSNTPSQGLLRKCALATARVSLNWRAARSGSP
ncbi:hypothetical protein LTT66_31980 [Nocardia gipuzkoensis]|uniref:hypothetical protein n=1 Tax=Nocardia gipuzkoensis TaxID=2749991 RepID=UPI001E4B7769|nr:hypothetical protein [Nocardia gipuzkoensis]UGT67763.1 hypothetical protein LTT66_31980 [Nocardia gipuzkoensis]